MKYKCMYCGKELSAIGHNPEDYNLHDYNLFVGKCTCDKCNILVTLTNRYISMILKTDGQQGLDMLEQHIVDIKNLYSKNTNP